jgi:hypothetical protein
MFWVCFMVIAVAVWAVANAYISRKPKPPPEKIPLNVGRVDAVVTTRVGEKYELHWVGDYDVMPGWDEPYYRINSAARVYSRWMTRNRETGFVEIAGKLFVPIADVARINVTQCGHVVMVDKL